MTKTALRINEILRNPNDSKFTEEIEGNRQNEMEQGGSIEKPRKY